MTSTPDRGRLMAVPSGDDPYAQWDGAYVLGALSATERREYEAHLSGCASCRAAVSELGELPSLLGLLTADEMTALDENAGEPPPPPPEMRDSLVSKVSRRRRRSRQITLAVAALAAAVLAVGLLIVARPETIGLQRQQPAPVQVALDQVKPSPIQASVALISHDWGTEINMTCNYGNYTDRSQKGGELAMVVVGRDGNRIQAATWTAKPDTSVTVGGATSTPVDQIASVQLVSVESGEVLLQRNL